MEAFEEIEGSTKGRVLAADNGEKPGRGWLIP